MKKTNEGSRMKLVDGEEISIAIDNVCRQQQILVRLGANLVAGIYNKNRDSAVYLWKKDKNDVYQYIGDVSVYDHADGTAMIQVVPANGGGVNSALEKKSLGIHYEQINEYARLYKLASSFGHSPPQTTKMGFLVGIPGAIPKD
jgi:hypothetical protein